MNNPAYLTPQGQAEVASAVSEARARLEELRAQRPYRTVGNTELAAVREFKFIQTATFPLVGLIK